MAPDEIHRLGLEEIAVLEQRALELGSELGLGSLADVHHALRSSAASRPGADAILAATAAIRRAEARAGEFFPQPLPSPCEVTAMPTVVASSGTPPHYTPPRLDGGRAGTFWFNLERPTVGTGWDLEVVAFHEGVPGHHLQLLHALGWGREQAGQFLVDHVPMPDAFLASEVDRYIILPGQALSYLIGKRELLRLREEAIGRLGASFTVPGFHAAVLDSGSLPMPVLADKIRRWPGSG
jgi:uncharacterized protein (DUF885 family)